MEAKRRIRRRLVVLLVLAYVGGTVVARRLGYGIGGTTFVRCRHGHVFTTLWIPGISLKSVRLGWWRVQRCPVGPHWSVVVPVRERDLGDAERAEAIAHHDVRIP